MKRILMLNTLPIINFDSKNKKTKTAGNQTLYNTLKGYSDNGYHVTMLTFFDVPKTYKPFPNIVIKRTRFYSLFNLSVKINGIIKKKYSNRTKKSSPATDIVRTGSMIFMKFWEKVGYYEGLFYAWRNKPDIVYGYEIYSTIPSKRIADKLGIPSVSRFQGTELGFFLNDEVKFNNAICYSKGTKVQTDLVIMANDGTDGDKVLNKLMVEPATIRFWVNGLHDKDKYINYEADANYKTNMNLPKNAFVICTANRFVDWKRIDRIIKMVAELVKLNSNVYLVAIGDGPEKPELVKLANSLNLKNIIFTGAMEHNDAIYHIANSDLYITLNHSGNLGNSILEALALGKAICTLRNDSVEKVLKNGYNSLLFSTIDEKEIAKQLVNTINDDNKLKTLKYNARKYARENLLSWEDRMKLEVNDVNSLIEKGFI